MRGNHNARYLALSSLQNDRSNIKPANADFDCSCAYYPSHGAASGPIVSVTPRRFPPPWSVEELDACFVVMDGNGQKLTYVYYEEEPGRRAATSLLTKDEARRIAVNIAKMPELVRREPLKPPPPEQRGQVENWFAEKQSEEAAGERWTLLSWAFVGVLAGIIIIGAIALWLAK